MRHFETIKDLENLVTQGTIVHNGKQSLTVELHLLSSMLCFCPFQAPSEGKSVKDKRNNGKKLALKQSKNNTNNSN